MLEEKQDLDLHGLALVVVTGAWLAGIALASWLLITPFIALCGAGAALLLGVLLWHNNLGRLGALLVLTLLLGMGRYALASPLNDPLAVSALIGIPNIEVQGNITDEPALQGQARILLVSVESISRDGGNSWRDAHGNIEVQTLGTGIENPYSANYGDSVELQGRLQAPQANSSPAILAGMAFPRVSVTATGGNPIIAALYHLRVMLATSITRSLPQPEAALLVALLLGLHTPALKPLLQAFNITGTTHLLVPSGFKVTILAGLIASKTRWLFQDRKSSQGLLLPAQKRQARWRHWLTALPVVAGMIIYTVLSGAGPAAIRAGIMGTLLILAPRLDRTYNVYTALALAALLMSLIDPFTLWNAGFQLSLLGTLGIVMLTPFFQRVLHPLTKLPFGQHISELIAVTVAAEILTLPIFALTFKKVSFIAPITNLLTVPLLEGAILLGMAVAGAGLLLPMLGTICGWVAWPVLWYMTTLITWFASLPWMYWDTSGININLGLAWGYYGLLGIALTVLFHKWAGSHNNTANKHQLLTRRIMRLAQISAALLIILTTEATALATKGDGRLTITFLNVISANGEVQGEAILIRTPEGRTALIDGGADPTALSQVLDSRLPFWQRSLDMVVLTTPRKDHLTGLLDVIDRFQINDIVDAGMLHPNANYALWRRTIVERNLPYTQTRQGATITLGPSVTLQVLWPPSPLHKSGNEELDNALIIHLIAPGLRILFLGVAAMSPYALINLQSSLAPGYLQADIVQIVGEAAKGLPTALNTLLQAIRPKVLVVTPSLLSAKQNKAGGTAIVAVTPQLAGEVTGQVLQTAQLGSLEVTNSDNQWTLQQ